MTALRPVVLAAGLAAALAGALGASCGEPSPTPPSVYDGDLRADLHVAAVAGRWRVTLNGFPVWDRTSEPASTVNNWIDPDLNQALVSEGNDLRIEVWPRLSWAASGPTAGASSIRGHVAEVGSGTVAGTAFDLDASRPAWERALRAAWERWRGAVGAPAARDSVEAWAEANPVAVSVAFDVRASGGAPSFDAVFREAPVIGGAARDSARLRAYAVRLRDLTAARDTAALWSAFASKYADEFAWWGGADSASFLAGARDRVVTGDLVPFDASDVRLRSWAGGRVWELYRDGADGLLEPVGGGYRQVYVGAGPVGPEQRRPGRSLAAPRSCRHPG